jgi:thiamine biosynthesis lipoprotein
MTRPLSRRRFIRISAAAAGLATAPGAALAQADGNLVAANLVTWRGTMLGAVATMQIHHHDRDEARRLIAAACAEAHRLERIFSLYLPDSSLVELNRSGVLVAPEPELIELLTMSRRFAEATNGRFDPTVQPLWTLYADHFRVAGADPAGPSPAAVRAALAYVGHDRLSVSRDRIMMPRGMALTLNGIAQGFVTDKIVDLLRAHGVVRSLVDMGEVRAIGPRPDGNPWEVGIDDPEIAGRIGATLPIVDRAVSTSGAYGFRFDAQGRFNHLFDPATGGCANRYRSVTTVSPSATAADALSTAFTLMSEAQIRSALPNVDIEKVYLIDAAGTVLDIVA